MRRNHIANGVLLVGGGARSVARQVFSSLGEFVGHIPLDRPAAKLEPGQLGPEYSGPRSSSPMSQRYPAGTSLAPLRGS
jgi:hypothetical protein